MQIGIMTHYDVHNHGAQLQMYALCSFLRNLGYEASALTYTKNYDFIGHGIAVKYNISFRSIPIYLKYLHENGFNRTLFNIKKRKQLKRFRKKHELVGGYYTDSQQLDILVIGSDEIFSIESGLNPWFWGMGVPCDKTISYAASFGPTTVDFIRDHQAYEFVEAGIRHINQISVRDDNSQKIVKMFSGKEPAKVCDPVLLYGFMKERSKMIDIKKQKQKYVLIYSYDDNMNDPETVAKITTFAKEKGLKIVSVGYYHKWCDKNVNVLPLDIFSWFEKAEYVITDTFHGSVLSLLVQTQFLAIVRKNANKLVDLLAQYGLDDHIIDSSLSQLDTKIQQTIDFKVIEKITETKRRESAFFLINAIDGNCNDYN